MSPSDKVWRTTRLASSYSFWRIWFPFCIAVIELVPAAILGLGNPVSVVVLEIQPATRRRSGVNQIASRIAFQTRGIALTIPE